MPQLYSPLSQLKHQQLQLQHQLKQTQKPLHQPLSKLDLEDSDLIVDDEITFGRNLKARDFGKVIEDDLSDYVKFRLWLARQLAMKKFDQVHG